MVSVTGETEKEEEMESLEELKDLDELKDLVKELEHENGDKRVWAKL